MQISMSNVPKSKRSLSELEFYKTAIRLRVGISNWLLRDFGIKPTKRRVDDFTRRYKFCEEDASTMISLLDRYGIGNRLTETFPEWWVNERRLSVDRIISKMIQEIRMANSIYPTCKEEYYERRLHQDRAIGYVDALVEEIQFIADVLSHGSGVEIGKFAPWIELCEQEYSLLKGWRKSDNKFLSRLKGRGAP